MTFTCWIPRGNVNGVSRCDEVLITHRDETRAVAARRNVERLALAGSIARGEDTDASDCGFVAHCNDKRLLFEVARLINDLESLQWCRCGVAPGLFLLA